MSTLEKLIAQLCPDGVEYKPLGEVCVRHHGTNITAGRMAELACSNGGVRVFAAGSTVADVPTTAIPSGDVIKESGIIVKSRGYVGFEYYEQPFTHKNELWSYTSGSNDTALKFVYYYLLTQCLALQALARSKSVKLPQLATGDTDRLEIPIPPLSVQKEIVRMLDEMTGLIDALEKELAARKQQYEWCRERLLRMEDGVEYKPLGEVLKYEQPTKYIVHSTEYDDSFATPVLTAGQSFILGYTDEEDNHYQASKASPVIIFDDFTTATQWVDFEFKVKSSAMKILSLKEDVVADIHFVYFAIQCIGFKPGEHARHWIEKYSRFEIPLPPLPVQKEIVRMLDGMTGLIDTLEEELALRKQQYEYYRDTLLAFKRKPEVA